MFQYVRVGFISLSAMACALVLSSSLLEASGDACCSASKSDKACEAGDAKLKQVSTSEHANEQVVLNIEGMTCGGCESKVKSVLTKCPGVKDAQVDHHSGKAVVEVESGSASTEDLIKAVKKLGYKVSEG
ncbi:MAG: copper chaperone [Candidatus Scalindua sp. AMX11]|nr:MAG: copper chaperone [Candidatus Scalindua sp.]NOG83622.1 heavy-metal-associated domain-containing protein [Planctomycetota bacterium]RZV69626.1 MAG: copper chaperone [Candidatus Scalindua sp. SCAELEC01]TDE64110.1 MAG: copper chaperone [Candidatus Scalindua sp. AMX11]GJQ60144.1 MAG: hypothetical protein SCALA701_29450 [Candidatus Scalindua sp.]